MDLKAILRFKTVSAVNFTFREFYFDFKKPLLLGNRGLWSLLVSTSSLDVANCSPEWPSHLHSHGMKENASPHPRHTPTATLRTQGENNWESNLELSRGY